MRKETNFISLCSRKVCLFRNLRTVQGGYYCAKGRVAGNSICPGLMVFQSITSFTFHPLNGELTFERLFFCFLFFFCFFLLQGSFSWLILTRNILKGKLIILTQHLKIHFFHKVLSNAFPLEMTVKMQFVLPREAPVLWNEGEDQAFRINQAKGSVSSHSGQQAAAQK